MALLADPPCTAPPEGRIGPNAVLQMMPALDRRIGHAARVALLQAADLTHLPDGQRMIPQSDAVRLFRALAMLHPDDAPVIAAAAGTATGAYILAHRIPRPAQRLSRTLPRPLAGRLLARAVARHAWTFAGSGVFRVHARTPPIFEIAANPLAVMPGGCAWHAAVFRHLFSALVCQRVQVHETACCARGAPACRFALSWR